MPTPSHFYTRTVATKNQLYQYPSSRFFALRFSQAGHPHHRNLIASLSPTPTSRRPPPPPLLQSSLALGPQQLLPILPPRCIYWKGSIAPNVNGCRSFSRPRTTHSASAKLSPKFTTMSMNDAAESVAPDQPFPHHRLRRLQNDPSKTPLVLVACGSFSPVTNLHLRMFEMAADYCKFHTDFEVMGGYFSPVSDAYKKKGLASSAHRVRMCELAIDDMPQGTLMVDSWEATRDTYQPTAKVLDHFNYELNEVLGGAERPDGSRVPMRIILLAGADLVQTMSTPGVWSHDDLDHILRRYGAFIVEREGTDIDEALSSLVQWRDNIYVIQQLIRNDVSSTKIRLFLRRELSIRYLIPSLVIDYIEENNLYKEDGTSSTKEAEKEKYSGRASPGTGSSKPRS